MSEEIKTVKGQPVVVRDPTAQGFIVITVGGRDVLSVHLDTAITIAKRLEDNTSEYNLKGTEDATVTIEWSEVRARGNRVTIKKKGRAVVVLDESNARSLALLLRGYMKSEEGLEVETVGDPVEMSDEDKRRRTLDGLKNIRTGTRGVLVLADYDHTKDEDVVVSFSKALDLKAVAPPTSLIIQWGDESYEYVIKEL